MDRWSQLITADHSQLQLITAANPTVAFYSLSQTFIIVIVIIISILLLLLLFKRGLWVLQSLLWVVLVLIKYLYNPTNAVRSPPTLSLGSIPRFLSVRRKFFLATVTKCCSWGDCFQLLGLINFNYTVWSRPALYVKHLDTTLLWLDAV